MTLTQIFDFVLTREPERDAGFRLEIRRLAKRSLYIIGGVEIGLPLVGLPVGIFVHAHASTPGRPDDVFKLWYLAAFVTLGAITIAAASTGWGHRFGRILAAASGLLASAILIASYMHA